MTGPAAAGGCQVRRTVFREVLATRSRGACESGTSSLTIVPVPMPCAMAAPTAPDSTTPNVSSASTAVSPTTATATVCDVLPGGKVTVPLAAT